MEFWIFAATNREIECNFGDWNFRESVNFELRNFIKTRTSHIFR